MKDIKEESAADAQSLTINELLDEHESKGTALAKLARGAGLPAHRLYYYYRKRQSQRVLEAQPRFAPVRVVQPQTAMIGLELLIGADLRLRIPAGSDPAQVAAMVGALREC